MKCFFSIFEQILSLYQNIIIFVQFCCHSYVINLRHRRSFVRFVIRHSPFIFLKFLILHHSRMHSGVFHLLFLFLFLGFRFNDSFIHLVNYFISFCLILHLLHWLKAFIRSHSRTNDPSLLLICWPKPHTKAGNFPLRGRKLLF